MSRIKIYKASAGSGKTFSLTLEYFKIIFKNPSEYKNILAVTFTNKATEEMKSRIINELHNLAEGYKSIYAEFLKKEYGYDDIDLKNRAEMLRTLLLHDYGRISITTIDRFFQRIIKSFTKELGIYPGYNVELDSEFILMKAVDKIMQEAKHNKQLRDWIASLMNTNVDEGKSWNIKTRIAELGEEIFKEEYMLLDKETIAKFDNKDFLKQYRTFLYAVINNYEKELDHIGCEAIALIQENALEINDFKKGKLGCVAHFYKLKEKKFEELTKTARDAVDNIESWITKTCDDIIKSKIEYIYPLLNSLLKKCVDIYDNKFRYYLSAKQMASNLYQLGILNDLYTEIRNICENRGVMLLSDTTNILNTLIEGNDTSFLYEKTGNFYKHLMIDEFQDTSSMQWRNFRPLVVNTLSEGNMAMIVGDVKQSIYRWRNGDWTLLAKKIENEFQNFGSQTIVLKNNWRSTFCIVDFNNIFFAKASDYLKALYEQSCNENEIDSKDITTAYYQAEQNPKLREKGYVDIAFGPLKKEEGSKQIILDETISIINDIRSRGGELKNIVILVRNGKEGASIANYIMEYNKTTEEKIDFVSNDSLYVWSSPYIKFIVAVMKYIIEPYNMINKAVALFLYQKYVLKKDSEQHTLFEKITEADLFEYLNIKFEISSPQLMSYSLFETVEIIIDKFSLKSCKEEIPYIIAFQDLVFDYESLNTNSIFLFLEWWEKERNKKVLSTSEDVDSVRILTIHKSKGLEFDFVIVPFCNWELDAVRPVRRIWAENKEEYLNGLEYIPLNYSSKLADTVFSQSYYQEKLKSYIDNLNLLYVAQTRAKKELYLRSYSPKMNKKGDISINDIGSFIYSVLKNMQGQQDIPFNCNEKMELKYGQKVNYISKNVKRKCVILNHYPIISISDRLSVKLRHLDFSESQSEKMEALNKGKLMHEIFKSIRYKEDVAEAVKKVYLQGLLKYEEIEYYENKVYEYLSNQNTWEWFDRKYNIINERDIIIDIKGKIRPDRILVRNNNALVIDYKFGLKEDKSHIRQVKNYQDSLLKMGFEEVKGYIWYVSLNKIVSIVH